jgi:hypothetical protein
MTEQQFTGHTIYGTLGGIITIFLVNITAGDLLKTALLSAVGAVVSILVSLAVKYALRKWQK